MLTPSSHNCHCNNNIYSCRYCWNHAHTKNKGVPKMLSRRVYSYVQSVCVIFIMLALLNISSSQEEAGSLLVDLSSSLNAISVNQEGRDDGEVVQAATPILEAASNILNVSSNVRVDYFLLLTCCVRTAYRGLATYRYFIFCFSSAKSVRVSLHWYRQRSECVAHQ